MNKYIVVLIIVFVITGCNTTSSKAKLSDNQNRNIRVQQSTPSQQKILHPNTVSNRLEQIAKRNPNVYDANCVIIGNTAVIGINVNSKLDRSRVGTIKYSVAEALRKDPYGARAIVTADMDLAQRIKSIRKQIQKGRPAAGFADEMSNIVSRIIPQFPKATPSSKQKLR